VRSIYGNRTLNLTSEPEVRAYTGVDRARNDAEINAHNGNLSITGRNVTVAVLDTGIDGTHHDLSNRVIHNIKLVDTQSVGVGFSYPSNSPNLPNTDQLYGHGTFVAGLIAGNGSASNGKYAGVAPDARLIGLGAGDLTLVYVLNGLDYLLANQATLGVQVLNCSFSANTVYDTNDPVNVATRMLTQAGVNVVVSAGNTGPGASSLNPYAVAPWVVSVGATDTRGQIANFSSRGAFANSLFRPTLVAPGVNVVSLRGSGITNVTGAEGLVNADSERLNAGEIPYYTTSNGTSFSAPQVAGAIALMLEANPALTPAQVRNILQRTATPLAPYYQYEVGAGMLNVHAAVLAASFPSRGIGSWREMLERSKVRLLSDPAIQFTGVAQPGTNAETVLSIPEGALKASIQIAWGPLLSTNDLDLYVYDPSGTLRAQSNTINLPGLNGKRERVVIDHPNAGMWRVVVRSTLGVSLTSQTFVGTVEVGRAQYSVSDLDAMTTSLRRDVQQNLRTYTISPIGTKFRSDFNVSRSDLAMSLVAGARIPQYLSGQQTYQDVLDDFTRLFVQSVQASPNGPMFLDVAPGERFRPHEVVTRLTAAIALVRAAGLSSEAEARAGIPLALLDAQNIPSEFQGYVSVAMSEGLLPATTVFRPQDGLKRGDLARAMTIIQSRSIQ
jgi:serine protease AprX